MLDSLKINLTNFQKICKSIVHTCQKKIKMVKTKKSAKGALLRNCRQAGTTLQLGLIFLNVVVNLDFKRPPYWKKWHSDGATLYLAPFRPSLLPFLSSALRMCEAYIFGLFPSQHWISHLVFNVSTWYTSQDNMGVPI